MCVCVLVVSYPYFLLLIALCIYYLLLFSFAVFFFLFLSTCHDLLQYRICPCLYFLFRCSLLSCSHDFSLFIAFFANSILEQGKVPKIAHGKLMVLGCAGVVSEQSRVEPWDPFARGFAGFPGRPEDELVTNGDKKRQQGGTNRHGTCHLEFQETIKEQSLPSG